MAYTTIDNPELYMQTVLWTGDDSTSNAITLPGDENMQPDLIWQKQRNKADNHQIFDSVRGRTKRIKSNANEAETTVDFISSIDSDGFTIGSTDNSINDSSYNYVAWCWKESATAGFDIVSYTGDGSARTISHSLSAVPHLMIFKERNSTGGWVVYHHKNTAAPETDYLSLSNTNATEDYTDYWNDTAPTSSVFTIGDDTGINESSDTYVAYLFSEKQGYSKFGSYTGNGDADGPFVYTGFRPAWVLIKNYGRASTSWTLYDNKRPAYNSDNAYLLPDATDVEASDKDVDLLSNGFKPLLSNNAVNTSGDTYIFMAFAEAPFVNSKGVPCNAR